MHFRQLAKNKDRNEQKINTEISKILIIKISIKYKKKLQKRKTLEAYEIDPKISVLSNMKLIRNGKVAELQQKKRSQKRSPSVKKKYTHFHKLQNNSTKTNLIFKQSTTPVTYLRRQDNQVKLLKKRIFRKF